MLDISSGSKMQCFHESLFPDEAAEHWTVLACCELWKRTDLIRIMHLLSLFFSHIIVILLIEIFMYQAQGSGVYVHVNLISQRLWNFWHARGIRPQAVSVSLSYMNHTQKKQSIVFFAHLHTIVTCSSNVNTFVKLSKLTPLCKRCPCFQWSTRCSLKHFKSCWRTSIIRFYFCWVHADVSKMFLFKSDCYADNINGQGLY